MYTLENGKLRVSILDPVKDRERMGTRYCTGGYIFQVADDELGDLMTGPTFPASFNPFDGQGIPDAFNLSPLRDLGSVEAHALVLGVGICDLVADEVVAFCDWQVSADASQVSFATSHAFGAFAAELERTVSLDSRTVTSRTELVNTGTRPMPLRWFPHPFYPHPDSDELIRLSVDVSFPENPGYEMSPSGYVARKGWPWDQGHYQALDHGAREGLCIVQRHPTLGLVAARCSYVPGFLPIWGNPNTFSWEPFLERTLAPGQSTSWWIAYDF